MSVESKIRKILNFDKIPKAFSKKKQEKSFSPNNR